MRMAVGYRSITRYLFPMAPKIPDASDLVAPELAPRVWQRMLSGRRLDLLAPSASDIEIEDIAHGLARVARWNGQTTGAHAFSVAQHSLLVEDIVASNGADWQPLSALAALLHDAPEYVIGDLISPFKAVLGGDYKVIENRLLAAIHQRFGLPVVLPDVMKAAIKEADRAAAFIEATSLAGFSQDEAVRYFGWPDNLAANKLEALGRITPWPAAQAQSAYLARFTELSDTRGIG